MKMFVLILVTTALAEGRGSGPYLPSGWRPEGAAFFLPSEVVQPSPTPEIDLSLQGSEASGSDFLREYGPPKIQDISQNLLNQGLPDEAIEQTFELSAQSAGSSQVVAEEVVEVSQVNPEPVSAELPTTASQASVDDFPPISAELPTLDFVAKQTTTRPNIEPATEVVSQSNQQDSQESIARSNQQDSQESIARSNQQDSQESIARSNQQDSQESIARSNQQDSQESIARSNQQDSQESIARSNQQDSQESIARSNQQDSQESATAQTNQQESAQALESSQESSSVSDLGKVTSADSVGTAEVLLVNSPAIYDQDAPELQNIPDIIAGLEKEILTEQAEVRQAVSENASGQLPEGFLEYGPPALAEYGPPKQDPSGSLRAIQTNETRRRRFSPRIRFGKK